MSSQSGAADPRGPDRCPRCRGGTRSGSLAAGAAQTRARGRDEADQRQACRRWFIGEAQRLWQHATPSLNPGMGGGCPDPPSHPIPAPHLLPLQLQPSGMVWVWSRHMLGWQPSEVEPSPSPLSFPFHPTDKSLGDREGVGGWRGWPCQSHPATTMHGPPRLLASRLGELRHLPPKKPTKNNQKKTKQPKKPKTKPKNQPHEEMPKGLRGQVGPVPSSAGAVQFLGSSPASPPSSPAHSAVHSVRLSLSSCMMRVLSL